MSTDNKPLALVTGASRGLGAAMAEELAAQGYHIMAVARTTGGLEDLDDRITAAGGSATLAPLDVTDADAMAHMCRSIHDRWGSLAMWVHTAVHATALTPAQFMVAKDFDKTHDTNVKALSRLIPFVDPLLRAHEPAGTAVFFEDTWGRKFASTYGSSKAAQREMILSWQAESTTQGAPVVKLLSAPAMPTALRGRFYPGEDKAALTHPKEAAAKLLPQVLGAQA